MLIAIFLLQIINLLGIAFLIKRQKPLSDLVDEARNDLVDLGVIKNEGQVLEWEPPVPEEDLEAARITKELTASMSKCWECGRTIVGGAVRCRKCLQSLQGRATTAFWTPRSRILTGKAQAELVQPLGRDGFSNPDFDKLYGHKTVNPLWGTERDHRTKGMTRRQKIEYQNKIKEVKVQKGY